jgi:hypothetical protein
MGLNSGEVVVGKIGDDLRMDYTDKPVFMGDVRFGMRRRGPPLRGDGRADRAPMLYIEQANGVAARDRATRYSSVFRA